VNIAGWLVWLAARFFCPDECRISIDFQLFQLFLFVFVVIYWTDQNNQILEFLFWWNNKFLPANILFPSVCDIVHFMLIQNIFKQLGWDCIKIFDLFQNMTCVKVYMKFRMHQMLISPLKAEGSWTHLTFFTRTCLQVGCCFCFSGATVKSARDIQTGANMAQNENQGLVYK
jgi:hypothetical protein